MVGRWEDAPRCVEAVHGADRESFAPELFDASKHEEPAGRAERQHLPHGSLGTYPGDPLRLPQSSVNAHSLVARVFPRRKLGQLSRGTDQPVLLTIDSLSPYFHLPLKEAAEILGLCPTAIKSACRKFGLDRWPFRRGNRNQTSPISPSLQPFALPGRPRTNIAESIMPTIVSPSTDVGPTGAHTLQVHQNVLANGGIGMFSQPMQPGVENAPAAFPSGAFFMPRLIFQPMALTGPQHLPLMGSPGFAHAAVGAQPHAARPAADTPPFDEWPDPGQLAMMYGDADATVDATVDATCAGGDPPGSDMSFLAMRDCTG